MARHSLLPNHVFPSLCPLLLKTNDTNLLWRCAEEEQEQAPAAA